MLHYLARGRVPNVVNAMIAADRAKISLPWDTACAIDLAGRDILDAVQTSVNPKVIDCPDSSWFCADNSQCRVQPAPDGDPGFVFEPKNYAILFGTGSLTLNAIEDDGYNYIMESWICPPEEVDQQIAAAGFPGQPR